MPIDEVSRPPGDIALESDSAHGPKAQLFLGMNACRGSTDDAYAIGGRLDLEVEPSFVSGGMNGDPGQIALGPPSPGIR
jgi:hypothetical protein